MAKTAHEGRCVTITTPTPYGSHKSMVVKELSPTEVLCKDDIGEYVTFKNRLDNGMADPLRWSRYER